MYFCRTKFHWCILKLKYFIGAFNTVKYLCIYCMQYCYQHTFFCVYKHFTNHVVMIYISVVVPTIIDIFYYFTLCGFGSSQYYLLIVKWTILVQLCNWHNFTTIFTYVAHNCGSMIPFFLKRMQSGLSLSTSFPCP